MSSIVAVGLLGALALFPMSQGEIFQASDRGQATAILRGQLERIKNKGTPVDTVNDCPPGETRSAPFTLTCTTRSAAPEGLPTAELVTVTARWDGPPEGNLSMAAVVMRRDQ
jgi:hypothetical protein